MDREVMTVKEAAEQFRRILHDISREYDDYQVIMRLDSAAHLVSMLLVQMASPLMIREEVLHEGDLLPKNFIKTCGIYPIKRTGYAVHFINGMTEMSVRYFVGVDRIKSIKGYMPFEHDTLNDFTVRTACKYALNRNEFDISQDQGLLNELKQATAEAMGSG